MRGGEGGRSEERSCPPTRNLRLLPFPSPSRVPTYMPPGRHLGHGPVDAVGAGVEGAGIAQVVAGLRIPPPQGGPGGTAVGTLAALPPVVKTRIYW